MLYHHDFTELLKPTNKKKNFPMRTMVSTIETAPYGTSKYLVDVIQPTLNKNKTLRNKFFSICNRNSNMGNNSRRIHVTNLYPSIPIDKAIAILIDTLNND